jgi:hypothetical protein
MVIGLIATTIAVLFTGALIIRPVNDELMSTDLAGAGPRTRMLLEKWGYLHVGGSAMGAFATLLFLWGSASA